MKKFTLEDITNLVNEELEKYSEKQALIAEREQLETELETLNEVSAGGEMADDKDYHQGQLKPEFEKKGSHIVEEEEEEFVSEMDNDFDEEVMEEEFDNEFDEVEFEDPIPDMADPVKIGGGVSMDDEEAVKAELPTWMMGESGEMEEEVNIDAQIKEDLEEMMEPEMADEITETISEMEPEDDDFNASDYSGLGESEDVDPEEDVDENLYESVIEKRRKNIMSESMQSY
jgi:hypothetical protein